MWADTKWTTRSALHTFKGKLQQNIEPCRSLDLGITDTKWSLCDILRLKYDWMHHERLAKVNNNI